MSFSSILGPIHYNPKPNMTAQDSPIKSILSLLKPSKSSKVTQKSKSKPVSKKQVISYPVPVSSSNYHVCDTPPAYTETNVPNQNQNYNLSTQLASRRSGSSDLLARDALLHRELTRMGL